MLDKVAETMDGEKLLRQWMAKACCAAGEGRRGGGRSGFEKALGLHLRLIGAVDRYFGRCGPLPAGMLSNKANNSICFCGLLA